MVDIKNRAVFISGPMTGIDNYNVAAFCEAHAKLRALRPERVYDPAVEYLQSRADLSHDCWMWRCLNELLTGNNGYKYNCLVQLPGWESSEGARLEADVAKATGIQVVTLAVALEQ